MSLATRSAARSEPAEHAAADQRCVQCGAGLAGDQEWCLECGAARTLVHRPPDWRVPVAVVGGVIALALAGFVIALVSLSGNDDRSATTITAASVSAAPAGPPTGASTPSAASPSPRLAGWPIGLPGWTVMLGSRKLEGHAAALARREAATGIPVGILNSSQHPALVPGRWIVFSRRYASEALAQTQATMLVSQGHVGAQPLLVGRQGG